jgi:hypothetical protein
MMWAMQHINWTARASSYVISLQDAAASGKQLLVDTKRISKGYSIQDGKDVVARAQAGYPLPTSRAEKLFAAKHNLGSLIEGALTCMHFSGSVELASQIDNAQRVCGELDSGINAERKSAVGFYRNEVALAAAAEVAATRNAKA